MTCAINEDGVHWCANCERHIEEDDGADELERLRAELERVKRELADVYAADVIKNDEALKQEQKLNSARADNARLREALTGLLAVSRCQNGCHPEDTTCATSVADAALAATDPSPWLREFGMKVAKATHEHPPSDEPERVVFARIVDGVMK